MKKTYLEPSIESIVYDKDLCQLPIANSVGTGGQLGNTTLYDEEEDEEEEDLLPKKKIKSVWD